MRSVCCAVAVVCLTTSTAHAQEKVDDPYFKNWSKFPKGTAVVYKQTTRLNPGTAGATVHEVISTLTLLEVGKEKIVLEQVNELSTNGGPRKKLEPQKVEHAPRRVLAKGEHLFATFTPVDKPATSEEKVSAVGKEWKTTRYHTTKPPSYEGALWISDDVPGLKVKGIYTLRKDGVVFSEILIELVEIKKP